MKITFQHWLANQGVELRPWQQRAAAGLLTPMFLNREMASGKTQLLKWLTEFINENGNDYLVADGENHPVIPVPPKRKPFMR